MTQLEIEEQLTNLRDRLSQIDAERDHKMEEWRMLGRISLWVAVGFLIYSAALMSICLWYHLPSPSPLVFASAFVVAPLAILTRALLGNPDTRREGSR
jgi:hypothetical protein